MDINRLPQLDPTWPESAQQLIQQLIALSALQSEQLENKLQESRSLRSG